ncbi:MAG TPA: 16S rRNA (uracil(1498)-N(3))-methyltransferase [Planctomycetota bacterium]|nr:16S rRNA (uracil(1498)-N(3))-methyltransferase [Planctomycetota bacterium]
MVDRFFLPDDAALQRGRVEIDVGEGRHALRSRRLRAGDPVELLDGAGGVGRGRVRASERGRCVVEVEAVERRARDGREVHLALSAPRGPRMDDLVDEATQLGVASIELVVFARSVAAREDTSPARLDRWARIAREAAKQSGAPYVPEIAGPRALSDFLASPFAGVRLLLHPDPAAPSLARALAATSSTVRLLVGPEGGLEPAEVDRATAAGERVVSLGEARLRIETAALAALSLARLGGG